MSGFTLTSQSARKSVIQLAGRKTPVISNSFAHALQFMWMFAFVHGRLFSGTVKIPLSHTSVSRNTHLIVMKLVVVFTGVSDLMHGGQIVHRLRHMVPSRKVSTRICALILIVPGVF